MPEIAVLLFLDTSDQNEFLHDFINITIAEIIGFL
jgi:hypothetical protein